MGNIKNIAIVILVALCSSLYIMFISSRASFDRAMLNSKALQSQLEGVREENRQFMFDMNTLRNFNDSVSLKLQDATKRLKLKDKQVQYLQYLSQSNSRIDTLIFRDTIFQKGVDIDTLIQDEYYKLNLKLKSPNYISVSPIFKNEISTVIYTKREYVKPRKKFWIQRIFQRKHNVVIVDVFNHSPYVKEDQQRFIKIVK